ncbi:hypothetical protein C5167_015130 [Papaver somniferum]|uniref:S-adenosyl-L-homocysteine hydrolase NAD binding domain-containing protein n=1 Tax=Papaver somniferum TaxID=3469 RepID=A0A4Y7J8Z9_PAPSO|nr:hypothetical protein C5167_015130 [Papaver somniferum]
MRIREPKTTALYLLPVRWDVLLDGINIVDKFLKMTYTSVLQYARIIQKLRFPAMFKGSKIHTTVGSCHVEFPIRLERLSYSHGPFSSYEQELFPGLIYQMKQAKIVLLIFVSCRMVLAGAKLLVDRQAASGTSPASAIRNYQSSHTISNFKGTQHSKLQETLSVVCKACSFCTPGCLPIQLRSYNIGLGFKTPREATEANNGNQNYYFNFESRRIRVGDAYDLKDQLDKQGKKRLVDYLENVKSCCSKSDGLMRVTDVMIDGKIDVAAGQVNVGKGCASAVLFVSKLVPRS